MRFILFMLISLVLLGVLKFYIYKRFFKKSFSYKRGRGVIIGFFLFLFIMEAFFLTLTSKVKLNYELYILLGSCIVILYCLFISVVVCDVAKISLITTNKIAQKLKNIEHNTPIDSQRRLFLKILFDLGVIALFFLFTIRGFKNALQIPQVNEIFIKLPKLKQPKSIAMISDVHIGKALGKEFLCGIVEKINALNVDIVVIVGDLVDAKIELVKEELLVLNQLKSTEGTYFVTGNHEYYHGVDSIIEFLATLNLTILHNTNQELSAFNLAGTTDLAGFKFKHLEPNLEMAQSGLNPNKPSILLTHQPKFVRQNDVSAFDLVLCGHTHAGQVFPLSFFVWLDQHYVHGHYDIDSKTQLYVSSGAGFWGPAIRFLAPSEIAHIHLS